MLGTAKTGLSGLPNVSADPFNNSALIAVLSITVTCCENAERVYSSVFPHFHSKFKLQ